MATVIDNLIVALKLDPTGFQKGAREADAAFGKTRDSATKSGKSIEKTASGAADSLSKLRDQAIALFAIFTAGRGLKEFVSDLTRANTSLGNLAATIGVQGSTLDANGKAVAALGGSYSAAVESIRGFKQQMADLAITGTASILPYLRALHSATGVDLTTKGKSTNQVIEEIANALKVIKETQSANVATRWAQHLGFTDPTQIKLLEEGGAAYAKALAQVKKYAVSSSNIAAAHARTKAFSLFADALEKVGRAAVTAWTPAMVAIVNGLRKLMDAHPEAATKIFEALAATATVASTTIAVLGATLVAKLSIGALGGAIGALLLKLTKVAAALELVNAGLSALDPSDKVGAWIDRNIPGAGAIDNWFYTHTGGLVGRSSAQQNGSAAHPAGPYGDLSGSRFSGSGGRGGASSGASGTISGSARARAMDLMDRLVKVHGWTPEAAAIAAGNATVESDVRSNGPLGDYGTSGGLFQWHLGRLTALKAYAASKGKSWKDFNTQVDFFAQETQRRSALERDIKNQKTFFNAAAFGHDYEGYATNTQNARVQAGVSLYRAYQARQSNAAKARLPAKTGAKAAATIHHSTVTNNKQSSIENNIGAVHVNVASGDPNHIARSIIPAIQRNALAMQYNYGIT